MNLQLPTGNTIWISTEYYFALKDEDIDMFFQACVADNLGIPIENPFSNKTFSGRIELESDDEEEEI